MPPAHHLFQRAMAGFGERLPAGGDSAWSAPTPCPEWTVRDLVAHVVEEELWVAPLLAGEPAEQIERRIADDVLGDDPVAAWRRSAEQARVATDDDAALAATIRLPSGDLTGEAYLHEMFADHLIHTWDLARAVGASEVLDAELVAACADWFDSVEAAWRAEGVIADPVTVGTDADPQTALLARFGRRP